jgi:hypothetical protein
MDSAYRFTFRRLGGLDQVVLDTGEDLSHLRELDQKLWVALSCPARGLEIDPRTLSLLDTDGDGRVRALEVLAALDWCKPRLRSLGELIPSRDGLELASIDDATVPGRATLQAAKRILAKISQRLARHRPEPARPVLLRAFGLRRLGAKGTGSPALALRREHRGG